LYLTVSEQRWIFFYRRLGTTMGRHTLLDCWKLVCCQFSNQNKERQLTHMNHHAILLLT